MDMFIKLLNVRKERLFEMNENKTNSNKKKLNDFPRSRDHKRE